MVNNSSSKVSSLIDFKMEGVRTTFSVTLTDGVTVSAPTIAEITPYIRAGAVDGATVWRMECDSYDTWATPFATVWRGQVHQLRQTVSEDFTPDTKQTMRHVAMKQMRMQVKGACTTARRVSLKRVNKARREEDRLLTVKEGFAD